MKPTAAARWRALQGSRDEYLRRAIDCSSLTIPSLIPESSQDDVGSQNHEDVLESLYQGLGARGVSNLASKLLVALFPPGESFFRFTIDKAILQQQMEARGGDPQEFQAQVDSRLSQMEQMLLVKLEKMRLRPALFELFKHLIVSGNGLLYVGPGQVRTYGLRSFVASRDAEGNIQEVVIKEMLSERFLPRRKGEKDDGDDNDSRELYTHIEWNYKQDRCVWYQEYEGQRIPRTAGQSAIETSPWLVLRLVRIAGESYGRGLVEEMLGDLSSLNELMRALVEGNLQGSKTIWLVNPNGMTRADALAKAENGDFVPGMEGDVVALRAEKGNDYSAALQMAQVIERRLQYGFLMNETVQRNAERVTAEEIRVLAQSLDIGMAGYYTVMSDELQMPLVKRVSFMMQEAGELPPLPEGLIEPQVTTGVDAIGRGNEKVRLQNFLAMIAQALGPEALATYIKPEELLRRFAASDGIDTTGLVRTEDELQQMQAQAEQSQLASQIVSGVATNGVQSVAPPQASAQ